MVIMVERRRGMVVAAILGAIAVPSPGSLTALLLEAPLACRLIPDTGGRSGCGG
jgi:hypothetical protein